MPIRDQQEQVHITNRAVSIQVAGNLAKGYDRYLRWISMHAWLRIWESLHILH